MWTVVDECGGLETSVGVVDECGRLWTSVGCCGRVWGS